MPVRDSVRRHEQAKLIFWSHFRRPPSPPRLAACVYLKRVMKLTRYLLLCLAMTLVVQVCAAQDAKGCKDSLLISRFPGSVITDCEDKRDDTVTMSLPGSSKKIEGEIHKVSYRFPKT